MSPNEKPHPKAPNNGAFQFTPEALLKLSVAWPKKNETFLLEIHPLAVSCVSVWFLGCWWYLLGLRSLSPSSPVTASLCTCCCSSAYKGVQMWVWSWELGMANTSALPATCALILHWWAKSQGPRKGSSSQTDSFPPLSSGWKTKGKASLSNVTSRKQGKGIQLPKVAWEARVLGSWYHAILLP